MNTPQTPDPKGCRLSFIINTVVGGLMLLLSAISSVFETIYPQLRGTLAWGFTWTAVVCLFIASLHYAKHLSLTRR
jgi:formate hydrogenlyase subunit 4